MLPEIKAIVDGWASRRTVPPSAARAAPLLLEARKWLEFASQAGRNVKAYLKPSTSAFDKLQGDLIVQGLKDIELFRQAIDELLIEWGFDKDDLNQGGE